MLVHLWKVLKSCYALLNGTWAGNDLGNVHAGIAFCSHQSNPPRKTVDTRSGVHICIWVRSDDGETYLRILWKGSTLENALLFDWFQYTTSNIDTHVREHSKGQEIRCENVRHRACHQSLKTSTFEPFKDNDLDRTPNTCR